MKKKLVNMKLFGLCIMTAISLSCKQPAVDNKNSHDNEKKMELKKGNTILNLDAGVSVKTPDWTKNPKGKKDLPSVKEDGSKSNVNVEIMTEINNLSGNNIDVKNVIFMLCENLTEDLLASTEEKYGELITNDLPLQMSFTAESLDNNTENNKIIGLYLAKKCFKKIGYATTGIITNSIFRQFKSILPSSSTDKELISEMLIKIPRPVILIGKDTEKEDAKKECSLSSPNYVNEIYKGAYKYTSNFNEAVSCYNSHDVFFEGFDSNDHKDIKTTANGVLNIFDSTVKDFPSAVQIVKFGLAWTETKADPDDGFAFVFYDSAEREDKEAALKNFDEAVATAAKYVLENPDTILIVTSAALDGSTIPAFVLGNGVEKAKDCTTLLDFTKTMFEAE